MVVPFVGRGKTRKKTDAEEAGVSCQEFRYGHAEFEMPVRYQRSTKPNECLLNISILVPHRHVDDKVLVQLRQKNSLSQLY